MKNGSLSSKAEDKNIGLVSASELCQLIKTCAKSGVRSFHFGEVYLEFGPNLEHQPIPEIPRLDTIPSDNEAQKKLSEEAARLVSLEQVRQDIDELKLSDPLAYEQFIEGEIGDVGGVGKA